MPRQRSSFSLFAFQVIAVFSFAFMCLFVSGWIRSFRLADGWEWTRASVLNGIHRALFSRRCRDIEHHQSRIAVRRLCSCKRLHRAARACPLQFRWYFASPSLLHNTRKLTGYPDIKMLGLTDMKDANTSSYGRFGFGRYDDPEDRPDDVYRNRSRSGDSIRGFRFCTLPLLQHWRWSAFFAERKHERDSVTACAAGAATMCELQPIGVPNAEPNSM